MLSRARARNDEGAALVEFALVLPFLALLLFGIIEFGWTFGQYLDVRHGARESARLTAVNYRSTAGATGGAQSAEIVAETCDRLTNPDESTVEIRFDGAGSATGDPVTVEVTQGVDSLTGFLDPFLPTSLTSEATSRLERPATFVAVASQACP
ncbi:TadE/TadG family type IV pilus assembly protein [Rhabdothermincola salaria]|uniref:TadE/TadG family type IV pilus assembly protein n=1 Tax=Rhabdothermincola salaria TaxID=2903142 RepID=UPI001E51965C|nr:TadE/TadG family type IV pilus assembly protein [Rhabdothermincola salaria]MCD9623537.1 pilus assembly protein [Rhabdothermincola salaria]